MVETSVDTKYLAYNEYGLPDFKDDNVTMEEIIKGERNKIYQNSVVGLVQHYLEDKYADLDSKRVKSEREFELLMQTESMPAKEYPASFKRSSH